MKKILFLAITIFLLFNGWVFANNYSQELFDNKYLAKKDFFWKNFTTSFIIWENSWTYILWTNGNISENTNLNFLFNENFTGNIEIKYILNKKYILQSHSVWWDFQKTHNNKNYIASREVTDKSFIETFSYPIKDQKEFNLDFEKFSNNYYHNFIDDIRISLIDEDENKISVDKFYFSNSNNKNFIYTNNYESQSEYIKNLPLDNIINNFRTLGNLDEKNIIILDTIDSSEYKNLVKLIYSWENRIILDTQKNLNLIKYLFWDNYQEYEQITYYNKYLNQNVRNIYNLPVFTNGENKFVKIPVTWYQKWDIIINKFDEKFLHYFWNISVRYYKKTNTYKLNTWYFRGSNSGNDISKDIREKYSFLSKVFAYMIISYVFILFWSIFFFFNFWKNRFKNIYIVCWLSILYLIIYWVLYLFLIGNNDNINYVIERQIYDNFEIQTHNIYDFSLSSDEINFDNKRDEIFQVLWKRFPQAEKNYQNINYIQTPLNTTQLKFNVLKFSNDLDFTATDNFQIDISHNNFKNYYNQSQKYSANKVYHTSQKTDIFYNLFKPSDKVNYFLIEAKY